MENTKVENSLTKIAEVNEVLPIAEQYAELFGDEVNDKENKRLLINYALALKNVKTKTGAPAVTACTKDSIVKCGLDILNKKLDLSKSQVALIVYGNTLSLQMEYFGRVALVKSELGIDIHSAVIHEGDTIDIDVDEKGVKHITHKTKWENLAHKVTGAYAVATKDDAIVDTDIMTFQEIYNSWLMSQGGIKQTHKQFTGEMARKTVESRLCKHIYQKSGSNPNFFGADEDEEIDVPNNEVVDPVKFEPLVVHEEPKVEPEYVDVKVEETKTEYVSSEPTNEYSEIAESIEESKAKEESTNNVEYTYDDVETPNEPASSFNEPAPQEFDYSEPTPEYEEPSEENHIYSQEEANELPIGSVVSMRYGDAKAFREQGNWEIVPQTYDPATKTTKVKRIS